VVVVVVPAAALIGAINTIFLACML